MKGIVTFDNIRPIRAGIEEGIGRHVPSLPIAPYFLVVHQRYDKPREITVYRERYGDSRVNRKRGKGFC